MYEATNDKQFKESTRQLKNEIDNNSELREKFDDEQLEQIGNLDVPSKQIIAYLTEQGFEVYRTTPFP